MLPRGVRDWSGVCFPAFWVDVVRSPLAMACSDRTQADPPRGLGSDRCISSCGIAAVLHCAHSRPFAGLVGKTRRRCPQRLHCPICCSYRRRTDDHGSSHAVLLWKTTGNVLQTPYSLYLAAYNPVPFFPWQALKPAPEYHHAPMRWFIWSGLRNITSSPLPTSVWSRSPLRR